MPELKTYIFKVHKNWCIYLWHCDKPAHRRHCNLAYVQIIIGPPTQFLAASGLKLASAMNWAMSSTILYRHLAHTAVISGAELGGVGLL